MYERGGSDRVGGFTRGVRNSDWGYEYWDGTDVSFGSPVMSHQRQNQRDVGV